MAKSPPLSVLTSLLVRLARLYRLAVNEALSGLELSDALALPMVLLGRSPNGVRQHVLAEELGVEGPSVVRLLDRLVEAGLVVRREDPADRRAKTVHLTAAGQEQSRQASRALDRFREELFKGAEPADIDACYRVLSLIETRVTAARNHARGED